MGYGSDDIPALEGLIRSICRIEAGDGLEFLIETVQGERIREEQAYQGVRVKFIAKLGKARIPLQVDVGFDDASHLGRK